MMQNVEETRRRDSSGRFLKEDPEEVRAAQKRRRERWNLRHPGRMELHRTRWRARHPIQDKESKRAYKERNRDRLLLDERERHWNIRMGVLKIMGGKCEQCGIDDPRILQINHLNGGGNAELRKAKLTNRQRDLRIMRSGLRPTGLNLLCANCNVLYEYERGARFQPDSLANPKPLYKVAPSIG